MSRERREDPVRLDWALDGDSGDIPDGRCQPLGHGVGVRCIRAPQLVGEERDELRGAEPHLAGELHVLLADEAEVFGDAEVAAAGKPRIEDDDGLGEDSAVLRAAE